MTDSFQDIRRGVFILSGLFVWMCWTWVTHLKWVSVYIPRERETEKERMEENRKTFYSKGKKLQKYTSHFLDDLYCQVSGCRRCWRCCMPSSIPPCFSSYFPPPSTQPPQAHTFFQPPSSIQTEIQPHQTSVLMSEGQEGIYFYFRLEPLPPEHLTRFHTSSHLQSPTETQSSCLSSIIQNNLT